MQAGLCLCFSHATKTGNSHMEAILHKYIRLTNRIMPGHVAQLVTCLTADTFLTADSGVGRLITAQSHTFLKIDREIISTAILLPSADSRRVVVSNKQKYVHEVLRKPLSRVCPGKSVAR